MCASLGALWLLSSGSFTLAQQAAPKQDAPVVEGKVCDATGAVVVGASLRIAPEGSDSSTATRLQVNATTDETGKYLLVAPGAGRYVLRATANGFATLVISDIALARGEARRMDLVLEVAKFDDPIAVKQMPNGKSEIPPVEFSDTPNFTVAGVTDRNNMGLHGSDANVRTSDVLAKETAALKSSSPEKTASSGAGDAHRLAGDSKEKDGDPLGAEKEYEAAVKADPSEENYFAWGAELLLYRAGPATVQVFAKGAQLHPLSERLRAGLGAAYYADGQYTEAAAQMCRASDLNPSNLQPYLFLGKMEKAAAEPLPCSEEHLKRFVDQQPGEALAHYYYALVLWKKARKAQDSSSFAVVEEHLIQAAKLNPSFAEVYVQLGLLHNARGQKGAALAQFQKAVTAQPDLSAAHYQLSLAYRRGGVAAKADDEMKTYERLQRSEDAQLEKERREMRQFVTVLKDNKSSQP
jgi:tetratricopeptide (TPR) repeat protein